MADAGFESTRGGGLGTSDAQPWSALYGRCVRVRDSSADASGRT